MESDYFKKFINVKEFIVDIRGPYWVYGYKMGCSSLRFLLVWEVFDPNLLCNYLKFNMVQLPRPHIWKIFCILIVWYSKAHVLQVIYILGNHSIIVVQYWVCWKNFLQVVVNANKLAKLVKKKKKLQNWLDYYQLKHSRNNSKRPMMKVMNLICHFVIF